MTFEDVVASQERLRKFLESMLELVNVKMPVISFSTLKDKILSGEKKQTIRLKRSDYWLKFLKGDPVYGYWKLRTGETEKLFESEFSEDPFIVKWKDFDDELMVQDGFESLEEANRKWFIPNYGERNEVAPEVEFIVLRGKKPRK